MKNKKIAYLLVDFPSPTETFILKEILYIQNYLPIIIIVLRKTTSSLFFNLTSEIIYLPPWYSPKIIFSHLYSLYKKNYWRKQWRIIFPEIYKQGIIKTSKK